MIMKSLKHTLKLLISFALIALMAACSSTSKGGKNGEGLSEADLNAQRDARFGEGGIPTAEGGGMFRDVHFDYDSSVINDQARQEIEYNVEVMKQHPELKVQVEGHCDERGTAEYNLSLGQRRAKAVKDVLNSYGMGSSKVSTISYGAEVPLDPGHNESAWARNRRAHFSPFSGSASGGSAESDGAGSGTGHAPRERF